MGFYPKDVANGVASIDSSGKIPLGDLPLATSSYVGAVKPDNSTITVDVNGVISSSGGTGGSIPISYNASTNTPALASITAGQFYQVTTAGAVTANITGALKATGSYLCVGDLIQKSYSGATNPYELVRPNIITATTLPSASFASACLSDMNNYINQRRLGAKVILSLPVTVTEASTVIINHVDGNNLTIGNGTLSTVTFTTGGLSVTNKCNFNTVAFAGSDATYAACEIAADCTYSGAFNVTNTATGGTALSGEGQFFPNSYTGTNVNSSADIITVNTAISGYALVWCGSLATYSLQGTTGVCWFQNANFYSQVGVTGASTNFHFCAGYNTTIEMGAITGVGNVINGYMSGSNSNLAIYGNVSCVFFQTLSNSITTVGGNITCSGAFSAYGQNNILYVAGNISAGATYLLLSGTFSISGSATATNCYISIAGNGGVNGYIGSISTNNQYLGIGNGVKLQVGTTNLGTATLTILNNSNISLGTVTCGSATIGNQNIVGMTSLICGTAAITLGYRNSFSSGAIVTTSGIITFGSSNDIYLSSTLSTGTASITIVDNNGIVFGGDITTSNASNTLSVGANNKITLRSGVTTWSPYFTYSLTSTGGGNTYSLKGLNPGTTLPTNMIAVGAPAAENTYCTRCR